MYNEREHMRNLINDSDNMRVLIENSRRDGKITL